MLAWSTIFSKVETTKNLLLREREREREREEKERDVEWDKRIERARIYI